METEKISFTLTGEAAQIVFENADGPRKRGVFVSRALLEWQAARERGVGDSKDIYVRLDGMERKLDRLIERER